MKYETGGISAKTGEKVTVEVPLKGKPQEKKSGSPAQAKGDEPKPKQDASGKRLRVSIWVGHPAEAIGRWLDIKTGKFQNDLSMLQKAKGVLDDVSAISGIWFSKDKKVAWNPDSVPMFLKKAIDACHENNVQLTLGYAIADEGNSTGTRSKLFKDWIRNPTGPTLEQHAEDIMEFVFEKNKFDVDGLGFDLELNGLRPDDADKFITFYGKLADLLAAKKKWLHVATGIGIGGSEKGLLGTFAAQPFRLAKGHPNIIIRPMAYDMFNLDDAAFLQWHKDVVDYGVNKVGLDPGQLQLGLKTVKNSKVAGVDMGKNWSPTKCTFDANGVAARAKEVCKPLNVGVVTFAGWLDVATINNALNDGKPAAGTAGQPLQVPRP